MRSRLRRCSIAGLAFFVMRTFPLQGQESPPASPAPHVRRAVEWKTFEYACEGGTKLTVHLRNQTAKVVFKDEVYLMKQVISGLGTRYSDGKVVWWSKGEGGFLQEDSPDGDGKMIVKGCKLNKPTNGEAASVTGTVSYLIRMALPPEAIIQVQLQEATLADAPAKTIAEEKITLGERQVPVPFELKFDPAKIDPKRTYSVSARILVNGELRFINDQSYRVLTQGNPAHVEMILKPPVSAKNP